MISGIGNSPGFYSGTNSTSSLAQSEERLFAAIDTNGDGGISQSEFSNFLDEAGVAAGGSSGQPAAANALFAQMSGGSGSIGLQQFQANAGDLVTQLQKEMAAGSSGTSSAGGTSGANGSAAISDLLSQLTQAAQSLVAGSAAGIANAQNSATNTSQASSSGSHHHGHGHGHGGGGSLISQFMQQYQAAGATSAAAAPTISASA